MDDNICAVRIVQANIRYGTVRRLSPLDYPHVSEHQQYDTKKLTSGDEVIITPCKYCSCLFISSMIK